MSLREKLNNTYLVCSGKWGMCRMGRHTSIQPVMSAVLKVVSHSNILWRKGGQFYSLHDWLTRHGAVFSLPMGERYPG